MANALEGVRMYQPPTTNCFGFGKTASLVGQQDGPPLQKPPDGDPLASPFMLIPVIIIALLGARAIKFLGNITGRHA